MKEVALRAGFMDSGDKKLVFKVGDLVKGKITKDTKLVLKLSEHEGTYGKSFYVAEVEEA